MDYWRTSIDFPILLNEYRKHVYTSDFLTGKPRLQTVMWHPWGDKSRSTSDAIDTNSEDIQTALAAADAFLGTEDQHRIVQVVDYHVRRMIHALHDFKSVLNSIIPNHTHTLIESGLVKAYFEKMRQNTSPQ